MGGGGASFSFLLEEYIAGYGLGGRGEDEKKERRVKEIMP